MPQPFCSLCDHLFLWLPLNPKCLVGVVFFCCSSACIRVPYCTVFHSGSWSCFWLRILASRITLIGTIRTIPTEMWNSATCLSENLQGNLGHKGYTWGLRCGCKTAIYSANMVYVVQGGRASLKEQNTTNGCHDDTTNNRRPPHGSNKTI